MVTVFFYKKIFMKKTYLWLVFIFILWFSFFSFYKNINHSNLEKKTSANVEFNSWIIDKQKEIRKLSWKELETECRKIINWSNSENLIRTELYSSYVSAKKIMEVKDTWFAFFSDLKLWKVVIDDNLLKKEKEWSYSYTLLTSLRDKTNNCSLLKNENEKKECNSYFDEYLKFNTEIISSEIIWSSSIQQWKIISKFWGEKYLEILNNEFLSKCLLLDINEISR